MDSGDIAFMLVCTALVFLMTPGLAFFYGGLVQKKNVANTMMACAYSIGVATILWVTIGYSLSFGSDHLGIIGGFNWVGWQGVGWEAGPYADTIPHMLFATFQMMFAIITVSLLTGSIVGHMSFKALAMIVPLWLIVVYFPMAHMVWGEGGFLAGIGSVDFAGGTVVHISSAVSALVLAIAVGPRRGFGQHSFRVHNIPFVALGAFLLWFGWFGFNAGSALAANELAVHAFVTTMVAAASALVVWMVIDVVKSGRPTLVGASTGAVVGLVGITPGAGFVPVWSAPIIGAGASLLCYFAISLVKGHFGIDDALDVFACHGVGGIWGGIATGLFAERGINDVARWDGLIHGDVRLFLAQLAATAVTILVAAVGTWICVHVVKLITPLRVSEYQESRGLDISQHGERAYPAFNGLE